MARPYSEDRFGRICTTPTRFLAPINRRVRMIAAPWAVDSTAVDAQTRPAAV
jgi:hypothetical protein